MRALLAVVFLAIAVQWAYSYPVDGYADTGIRRLEQVRLTEAGEISGSKQPPGALLLSNQVDIRLAGRSGDLPSTDPEFSEEVVKLLGEEKDGYSIAVLDLTDPNAPAYAEFRGDYRQNVGSVGKLVAALGFFQALADTYPDVNDRSALLRNTTITADRFSHSDHHTIRLFDVEKRELTRRRMADGDQGNLWEYLDWMLSVSSNAAAAMVMRDSMMLRGLGPRYPLAEAEISPFFDSMTGGQRTDLFKETFWQPLPENGFSLHEIRQGSFFTREGKHIVNGGGLSYANARSLMLYLLKMEQGRLIDPWTSRTLKRLLYVTERRIRYASSPALKKAAVYFKSGSLYSCRKEEGFQCGAYKGNVKNYMNSVAIVEQKIGDVRLHYAVALISNVLRKNSAVIHQSLGTGVHQLIRERHDL
ncbi:MAG: hypothetical protein ABJK25_17850 [Halieaceae bacterium]